MTFDEQLRRAFETLTGHLRDEVARQLRIVGDELATSAQSERDQAVAEARQAIERESAERTSAAVAAAEAAARETVAAAEAATQEAVAAAETGAREAIAASEAAAREGGRKEGRKAGRLEGRREAQEEAEEAIKQAVSAAVAELRSIEAAASARLVNAVRAIERARSLSEILDTLVSCAGREASRAAVLLVRGARFREWRFVGFPPSFDAQEPVEFGAGDAGFLNEAVRTGAAISGNAAGRGGAPAFAELPPEGEALVVPIVVGGQIVAVLYADQGAADPSSQLPSAGPWPCTLEVLSLHAARCLEALTASKAARVVTELLDPLKVEPDRDGGSDDPRDDEASARRYERLLVSEREK